MNINSYLFFDGTCEEAFAFYEKCFGGKVITSRKYGDHESCAGMEPEFKNRIMHASLQVGDKLLMASDCPPGQFEKPQGFAVSLEVSQVAEAERIFAELAEKAITVTMPMGETFWSRRFGMLTDRFGIPWMIGVSAEERMPA